MTTYVLGATARSLHMDDEQFRFYTQQVEAYRQIQLRWMAQQLATLGIEPPEEPEPDFGPAVVPSEEATGAKVSS